MNSKTLEKRQKIEREFHDKWANSIKLGSVNFRGSFNSVTATENKFAYSQMGDLKSKKILDLGCGMGDASIFFASQGARVYSVDISPGMVKVVKNLAKKNNYSRRVLAKVMAAEKLEFKNDFFDIVYGNGVLHHVYQKYALAEVYRVLKPNGIGVFIEPLKHNPIINIYRMIADKVRTTTEKPLEYKNLNKLTKAKFRRIIHREFHLFTLFIFIWFYLAEKANPNKERYWKKIIDEGNKIRIPFTLLKKLDDLVFLIFPFLKRYCWNTVLIFQK